MQVNGIYTQNLNINSPKVKLLPIGLANSMWPHGNMVEFYDVVKSTYLHQKSNNIYININPSTYAYRQQVLDKLVKCNWNLSKGKPYKDYLYELSSYYFCLCVRGNGIDTHRFWECQYLNVIPIILKSEWTQSYSNFPCLILNNWNELLHIDFHKEYLNINRQFLNFDFLSLSKFKSVLSSH